MAIGGQPYQAAGGSAFSSGRTLVSRGNEKNGANDQSSCTLEEKGTHRTLTSKKSSRPTCYTHVRWKGIMMWEKKKEKEGAVKTDMVGEGGIGFQERESFRFSLHAAHPPLEKAL